MPGVARGMSSNRFWDFLARPAFSLLRPRSSNRLEAAEAEAEEEDKVLSLLLKP